MRNIEEIVAALNARLEHTPLGNFYALRNRLNGGQSRHGGLFQVVRGGGKPLAGYAFHWGGRSELQFNIGFEDGGYFRFGVAFSLEPDRNLPDPVSALRPKILAFNTLLPRFEILKHLRMWWYQANIRSQGNRVAEISESLVRPNTFIFIGERVDSADGGVKADVIERAASVLVSLLPLYEAIEQISTSGLRATKTDNDEQSNVLPTYIARLAYNSQRWQRPTFAAEVQESGESYRSTHGFGHEDWLFRNEWLLDGWRYGFVQGVNSSRKRLLKEGRPFDLRLFTMPSSGDRRAVAEIREVECLSDEAATEAVATFERQGWLDAMRNEVTAAGGDAGALDRDEYAPFILNLRYRLDNVRWLDADVLLSPADPIQKITRYSLCRVDGAMDTALPAWRGRSGTSELSLAENRPRFVTGGWTTYSPEHIRMQTVLVEQLRALYPDAEIVCERDFVDVMMRTDDKIMLFEVKSDLQPLSVVRQALGQILEYAYHPRRTYDVPVQLVIAGRRPLGGDDLEYFEDIKKRFALPLSYWPVAI